MSLLRLSAASRTVVSHSRWDGSALLVEVPRTAASVCPDCRGTLVVTDDGSITGTPGATIPCVCAGGR